MSIEKTNNFLGIIVSLITIFGAICGAVAYFMPTDRSPTAARAMPTEETPISKAQTENPTTKEPSKMRRAEKPTKESSSNPLPDEPLPFSARAARLVKIVNFSSLVYIIVLLPVLLIGMAAWPPPETPWATVVSGFGVLGSVLVLIYGVLTLVIGSCAGVLDWPATIALLVVIPFGVLDLIFAGIVDQRNVNPDNLAYSQREKHRARYTRGA